MGRLINRAETNSLAPFVFLARGFGGEMAIRRGEAETGVEVLKGCLERLHAVTYEVCTLALEIALAEGLAVIGRHDEGTTLLDRAISRSEASGDLCYMPEVLRVRARFAIEEQQSLESARYWLERSLEVGRLQGAQAWQLRTATDLAALSMEERDFPKALSVLQPIFEAFDEGWETADLQAAGRLLTHLRAEPH